MRAPLLVAVALLFVACAGHSAEGASNEAHEREAASEERSTSCPATAPAPHPLPGVDEAELTLAYWLERIDGLDEPLLTPREIDAHVRAIADDSENGLPTDRASLGAPIPRERLEREVRERLSWLRERASAGQYVDASGTPLEPERFADAPLRPMDELRIALEPILLRCAPQVDGFYRPPVDPDFDRNSCSRIRPQEPVQILMRWPNGMLLARTRYALGWIAPNSALSPPVPAELREWITKGPLMRAPAGTRLHSAEGAFVELEELALLAANEAGTEVLFADATGLHRASAEGLAPTRRPLTRRALLEEAFARIDHPYGWGGRDGGVDCSRFVLDVMASFGLELPRHSSRQAGAGTYSIDLRDIEDLDERQRLIDVAAQQGIVLLYFPGHIMIYLGRDAEGTPSVIHSFSEYVEPCENGETLRRVDRVTVSDLTLGKGSSRRSFLERLERIVIFGRRAGVELMGVATAREPAPIVVPPARACTDSLERRIFRSPARPNRHQPLRVIATSTEELGPVGLVFVDPRGKRHHPPLKRLGGPPFAYWAEIEKPLAGVWTVVLGDGPNVAACEHIRVSPHPPREGEPPDPTRIWEPRLRWEADTEALYSAFIEQLFDYPIDEDRTWEELSVVLRDNSRNILFNHLGLNEEERLSLRPDCADLPYFLRAYFAWKLRLPFVYRSCSRGRPGRPPTCGEIATPEMEHEHVDEVEAFGWFLNRHVKRAVHSASGRTHPNDSETPLYPVPMTREALRPGTVFSDPYGHLLVVARWVPQGAGDRYGILIGADAQPDGTVGRRRFWRGTFLFDADTTDVGAGFKAFRPVLYDRREGVYETLPNEAITERAGYVPFSTAQYDGTTDTFYEEMEALINPRPLDAWQVQLSLIDALEESAVRRVVSVQNGEDWKVANPGRVMDMPEGTGIFLTAGPWEDYSTPSRDLRLLIAMDTVAGFPDVVRRHPARFGLEEGNADKEVERLRERLAQELARRRFRYRRSDGREQTLTLADLFERAANLEMAYNPNDCVEIRWGAPEGSEERRSCRRTAPAEQRAKMAEYREWFATRRRPVH